MSNKKLENADWIIQLGERLEKIRQSKNLNKKNFCSSIGYLDSITYGRILKGERNLTISKLLNLKERFPDVNLNWLITGKGEMIINEKTYKELHYKIKKLTEKNIKLEGINENYEKKIEKFYKDSNKG